mmetsp:Transcript_6985/g.11254  ORF Transcript_6985/g.11254 Transcript_6985/m.11254 type:complete len:112 (-) Transcript_6985:13-348(-)
MAQHVPECPGWNVTVNWLVVASDCAVQKCDRRSIHSRDLAECISICFARRGGLRKTQNIKKLRKNVVSTITSSCDKTSVRRCATDPKHCAEKYMEGMRYLIDQIRNLITGA